MQIYILLGLILHTWSIGVLTRSPPYYDLDNEYYDEVQHMFDDQYPQYMMNPTNAPREVRGWGLMIPDSQVSGIAVDLDGNPVIFHRGNRLWDTDTFNSSHHIQYTEPIKEAVVLTLKEETGFVVDSWGAGFFYLPHGITIDAKGNLWLTDVGLQQVLKFPPKSHTPSLTLGVKLQPGADQVHLCKPSAVAVSREGEIFVADGYCNSRILHFNPEGSLRGQYGHYGDSRVSSSLNIPHGIDLNENLDTLCIADRDNLRIVCIKAGLSEYKKFGEGVAIIPETNHLPIYDVAFLGNGLVGIAGSGQESGAVGFTANLDYGFILDHWEPTQGFQNPHSITVDEKRRAIYVSEIGPNRIWKFIVDEAAGSEAL